MSINAYRQGLRSAVRGLWNGVLSEDQFFNTMQSVIDRRLSEAWQEGTLECGISENEYTSEEQLALARAIQEELTHVPSFAEDIVKNSKANGGKLQPHMNRVEMWLNRYADLKNRGKAMACKNQKGRWQMNPAKENCSSCSKLNGRVKRMSFWQSKGILPRVAGAGYLICKGFRCGCDLIITFDPISPGPLPALP